MIETINNKARRNIVRSKKYFKFPGKKGNCDKSKEYPEK